MELRDEEDYARWLLWGTRAGVALIVATLIVYVTGIVAPHVEMPELPALWQLPLKSFLDTTAEPTGWRWLRLWYQSDFMVVAAITALVLVTPFCYLQLTVSLAARGRVFFAILAALQFAVFAGAALLGLLAPMAAR
jgi:hypothetical protein